MQTSNKLLSFKRLPITLNNYDSYFIKRDITTLRPCSRGAGHSVGHTNDLVLVFSHHSDAVASLPAVVENAVFKVV